LEQMLGLVLGEAGRRLIHDQHLSVLCQGLGYLGELPECGAEIAQHCARVDIHLHDLEDFGRPAAGFAVVDQPAATQRLGGQVDVAGQDLDAQFAALSDASVDPSRGGYSLTNFPGQPGHPGRVWPHCWTMRGPARPSSSPQSTGSDDPSPKLPGPSPISVSGESRCAP
jgi:hypothetical protein